jgi:hypothetical protein
MNTTSLPTLAELSDIQSKLQAIYSHYRELSGDSYRVKHNDVREDYFEISGNAYAASENLDVIIDLIRLSGGDGGM